MLVITRDPVADRIGGVVVAACTRTVRGLISELPLGTDDGIPADCVANFDTVHTIERSQLRRPITRLSPTRMDAACSVMARAFGCV